MTWFFFLVRSIRCLCGHHGIGYDEYSIYAKKNTEGIVISCIDTDVVKKTKCAKYLCEVLRQNNVYLLI